jgi:hypothetical protein
MPDKPHSVHALSVYQKTPAGAEELQARKLGLTQRLRSVLIMVDGKSTASSVALRTGDLDKGYAAIEELIRQGLVKSSSSALAEARGSRRPVTLDKVTLARDYVMLFMREFLGDETNQVLGALAAANTQDRFVQELALCRQILNDLGKDDEAKALADNIRSLFDGP